MEEDEFPFQVQFEEDMRRAREQLGLAIGDIYEDCAYHPVLCVGVDYTNDEIWGVSLVDGSYPRSCSLRHCGVRKLTVEEAWQVRQHGPADQEARAAIAADQRWWRE